MTTVSLHNLSLDFPAGPSVLHDVSLTVAQGELMVLLGPSGSGKTTILRSIAGLLRPSEGDIRFDERTVLDVPPEKRGAVMVFQEHALFPFMDVGANVAFGLKMRRIDAGTTRRKVAQALAAVQLAGYEDRRPDELSGGQRQRVALARALVIEPRVLLLDEPLSSLEPSLREDLRDTIRSLQQQAGITMIFVTHDQTDAVAVADRICLLMHGAVRQIGEPRSFFERPVDSDVARFFGGINFLPGIKRGRIVETDLGPLEVDDTDKPDGDVLVTIRPEAVEVGKNGHNNLVGMVESYSFHGLVARCGAGISDTQLQLTVTPYQRFHRGEEILLHLPRERIHLLPVENGR
ncbi:MAG: ABC transporter ATP-binding protein [Caldilineaceae bacterium]|uniref:ABC-type quaternary amine transporter n=1 Tax=Caldilineaceae bacterium SB0675_bin_29 TaxID=2605266 RepID=A0A6B1G5G9_9CHLR|nr:ABC transporter ATP-binding protein [Caldilineaceae bacterium]MYH63650.1 ABC transporter ATP-binding protein [Caldilineaceae bacterium SB0675_bin_29]